MNSWQEFYNQNIEHGMSEKKATFITDRQYARQQGTLKETKIRTDTDLPATLIPLVVSLGTGIHTIEENQRLASLTIMEKYVFDNGYAIRKKIDHLDQVTICLKGEF